MSQPNTQSLNDVGNLCQEPETKGFDLQAGQSWIYPTNYSVRDYQYNIIQEALHKNTLVSLPTGLGKTFIAAVVMYNFYRWYPHGKMIFMAPTRPLVKQQMDACYNVTAIPQSVTAELTGTKVQQSRTDIWYNKRVFFITPQVLQNDLPTIIELGAKIKCLVFDEAHRAKGNHAYCEVIRKLLPKNTLFRVLALSATPGNSSKDVIEVMQNLLIAHVEFRSEESPDVKPYVFERALETVVVPLGEKLQEIKDQYIEILEKYTRTLIKYKVVYGNCGNLTKGKIFMIMKDFQAKNSGNRTPNYGEIMKSLNICVTLYHAYESLIRCGLRAFLNFYEEHINNPLLRGNISLHQILDDLRIYLGPNAEVHSLPDGTFTKVPPSTKFGHPKFYKLQDILLTHFKHSDSSTRVIVFFEYRESASEAYALLSQSYPMIKSRVFVGQGSGVTQRDQINTIKAFREGTCNTLLSTCIGEEGLDVGDVDLIVCFDIANKSPIRMIQRMGRTGRKKEGRVVVLVTEGKEQQTLKDCLIYKNNLGNFISNTNQLEQGKYPDNPKMIPSYIKPKCEKMFITVQKPVVTKSNNLKNMLKKMSSEGPKFSDDFEVVEIEERIKTKVENFWDKEFPLQFDFEQPKINFHKHLEKLRTFQASGPIKYSKQTDILVSLLQFADSKRYNLPVTQQISKFSDMNRNLKQGDIRTMFAKPPSFGLTQEIAISSQHYNYEKEKDITRSFPDELFEEISNYISIYSSMPQNCKTCELLFECPKAEFQYPEKIDLSVWVIPDLSILDNITTEDLEVFADSLTPKSKEIHDDFLDVPDDIFDNVTFNEVIPTSKVEQKTLAYETPRNFDKILKSFRINDNIEEVESSKVAEKSFRYETPKNFGKVLNLLGDSVAKEFENDIFASVSIEKSQNTASVKRIVSKDLTVIEEDFEDSFQEHKTINKTGENLEKHYEDVLIFFKLASIDDIFENKEKSVDLDATPELICEESPKKKTPDLFDGSPDLFPSSEKKSTRTPQQELGSPILCSYERVQTLKAKKKLFDSSKNDKVAEKPKLSNLKLKRKSFYESTRNTSELFNDSPTKLLTLDVSDICDLDNFFKENESKAKELSAKEKQEDVLDISDLCDLSVFGIGGPKTCGTVQKRQNKNDGKNIESEKRSLNFIAKNIDKTIKIGHEINKKRKNDTISTTPQNTSLGKELSIEDVCDMSDFFGTTFEEKSEVKENVKESNVKINRFADLDDFCDLSSFLDTPKKSTINRDTNIELLDRLVKKTTTQTPNKNSSHTITQKLENNISIIDLTDSDFESSPIKSNPTQVANKILSQLSITQMLSLVAKTDEPKSDSQKENASTPKTARTQKFGLSLSTKTKKGILQLKQNADSPKTSQKKKVPTNTPKTKRKFNITLAENSDDDFEDSFSFKSPVFAKPKPVATQSRKNKAVKPTQSEKTTQKLKKRKKLFSDFIEEEAQVSDEGGNVVVSDDEDSGEDCFEASFVTDETQDIMNNTNMQAKYLQSVKSPRRGVFKIPTKFKHNISNVYSQEVNNEDNTYMNDSFCIEDDDADAENNKHELSELEILEKRLKEQERRKKRKKSEEKVNTKRRRIMMLDDDSD